MRHLSQKKRKKDTRHIAFAFGHLHFNFTPLYVPLLIWMSSPLVTSMEDRLVCTVTRSDTIGVWCPFIHFEAFFFVCKSVLTAPFGIK